MEKLTVIVPYADRPEQLERAKQCFRGLIIPEGLDFRVLFVTRLEEEFPFHFDEFDHVHINDGGVFSTGAHLNAGAAAVPDGWIMKWDVDVVCGKNFLSYLLPLLQEKDAWYNLGFFSLRQGLIPETNPIEDREVLDLVKRRDRICAIHNTGYPCGSMFLCQAWLHQQAGGCPPTFKGWGWEDYAQLYSLYATSHRKDPIPGEVTLDNVTKRIRDEVARVKTKWIFEYNPLLSLFHMWHPYPGADSDYKKGQALNKQALLDHVNEWKQRLAKNNS